MVAYEKSKCGLTPSAKPLLGHHALVWIVGFRMGGFVLSASGIRVFVLGNMGLG